MATEKFLGLELPLDRQRLLRYDINALDDLEALTGKPPLEMLQNATRLSTRALKQLLWAGLKHEDKALTPERVGELTQAYLDAGNEIRDLYAAVDDAIILSGILGAGAKQKAVARRAREADAAARPPVGGAELS